MNYEKQQHPTAPHEEKIKQLETEFETGIKEGKTFREMKDLGLEIKELLAKGPEDYAASSGSQNL